jgi:hypothetical protein
MGQTFLADNLNRNAAAISYHRILWPEVENGHLSEQKLHEAVQVLREVSSSRCQICKFDPKMAAQFAEGLNELYVKYTFMKLFLRYQWMYLCTYVVALHIGHSIRLKNRRSGFESHSGTYMYCNVILI